MYKSIYLTFIASIEGSLRPGGTYNLSWEILSDIGTSKKAKYRMMEYLGTFSVDLV